MLVMLRQVRRNKNGRFRNGLFVSIEVYTMVLLYVVPLDNPASFVYSYRVIKGEDDAFS